MAPAARPAVLALPGYGTGRPADRIAHRLSSNESPFPPSPAVVDAVTAAARDGHRYPPLRPDELAGALAHRHGVEPEQILLSGGSIAVLEQLIRAFAGPGDEVVYPWRSYEAYPILVGAAGATPVPVPLDGDDVDLDALAERVCPATRVVLVCNPNNPTGTVLPPGALPAFLGRIADRHPRGGPLVVVDEAYREFVAPSGCDDGVRLLRSWPRVAVLRTFSKAYGLAGLRVGYCVADSRVVDAARRLALPFTLSAVALAAALAAHRDGARVEEQVARIVAEREWLRAELRAAGLPCPRSGANFLWLPLGPDSVAFAAACADEGIGVRVFPGEGVRVTIGCRDASRAVVSVASSGVLAI